LRRAAGALAVTVVLAALARGAAAQPRGARTRVEGVAAWVGGTGRGSGATPILRSDVELRARMAIAGQTGRITRVVLPEGLLAATLRQLVGEVLIEREADRLRAEVPSEEAIERARARLAEESGGVAVLGQLTEALGVSARELEAIARRRAYVEAFLRANLEGNTVVSDSQVERAFEAGEHPFVGRDLDEVREVMRVWLARQVYDRDVARWIEVLHNRARVRILAEWSEGDDG